MQRTQIGLFALLMLASAFSWSPAADLPRKIPLEDNRGDFNPDAFRQMSDVDKLKFVLAVLEKRDRTLQNFSYKLTATVTNVRIKDGFRRPMGRQETEFRRMGQTHWVHRVDLRTNIAPYEDPIASARVANWDGQTGKEMSAPEWKEAQSVHIRPVRSQSFALDTLNQLLGLHLSIYEECISASEFIRGASRADGELRITDELIGGVPAIRIEEHQRNVTRTLWLDPARGYMIQRFETNYDHGQAFSKWWDEVRVASQIAGVWVPTEAVSVRTTSASEELTEVALRAEYQFGKVTDQDLRIDFPPQAAVYDTVRGIAYAPENGKFTLLPFTDEKQVYHVPPRGAVVDRIDEQTPKLYMIKDRWAR